MKIAYRGFEKSGRQVSDVIDAASVQEAGDALRRQGLFITELGEAAVRRGRNDRRGADDGAWSRGERALGGAGGARLALLGRGRSARLRDAGGFVRQLAVLVVTGTPMVEAITALERQLPDGEWKTVLGSLRVRVEEGAQLSDAMRDHPRYFDPVSRSLVAAGESGGQLDAMLKRLSALLRQSIKVRSMVIGAMVYPALLITVAIGVLAIMIGFVMPRFRVLFDSLGAEIPPTTRLLMDTGAWSREHWWAVLLAAVAAIVGTAWYLGSDHGKRLIDRAALAAPRVGGIARGLATARLCRVLGVLMEGRVPLLDALALTRESTGSVSYAALVDRMAEAVTRGEGMSGAMMQSRLIPSSVAEAVRSGEKTGQLGLVLTSIAEYMDEDNEIIIKSLASIVEPLILLVLGLVVGFVAISMFLPLFDITATAGRG